MRLWRIYVFFRKHLFRKPEIAIPSFEDMDRDKRSRTLKRIGQIAFAHVLPPYVMENYPSGWWIEFPAVVEHINDTEGEAAAEEYIRVSLESGTCEDAFRRTHV